MNCPDYVRPGLVGGVLSYGFSGRGIRAAETVWLRRCLRNEGQATGFEDIGCPLNHILMVLGSHLWSHVEGGPFYAGEAVGRGNVVTPLTEYLDRAEAGDCVVWFMEVKDATEQDEALACQNWNMKVRGKPYDFQAYLRLPIKAFLWNVFPGWAAGSPSSFYCSEGPQEAYCPADGGPPHKDIAQDANSTPMHYFRACEGGAPQRPDRKKTLRLVGRIGTPRPGIQLTPAFGMG